MREIGLAVFVQGRNLAGGNPVHQRPEVGGLRRESSFRAKYSSDISFGKLLSEPRDCFLVTVLQDPEDRVVGIGLWGEGVEIRIPE